MFSLSSPVTFNPSKRPECWVAAGIECSEPYPCQSGSRWGCCSRTSPSPLGSGDRRHSQGSHISELSVFSAETLFYQEGKRSPVLASSLGSQHWTHREWAYLLPRRREKEGTRISIIWRLGQGQTFRRVALIASSSHTWLLGTKAKARYVPWLLAWVWLFPLRTWMSPPAFSKVKETWQGFEILLTS